MVAINAGFVFQKAIGSIVYKKITVIGIKHEIEHGVRKRTSMEGLSLVFPGSNKWRQLQKRKTR